MTARYFYPLLVLSASLGACSPGAGSPEPQPRAVGADSGVVRPETDASSRAAEQGPGPTPGAVSRDAGSAAPTDATLAPDPTGIILPANQGPLFVEIGVPDPSTGLGFVDFSPGDGIPIGGLGQAGLTARLALRVKTEDGSGLEEAFIRVELVNDEDATRDPGIREFDVFDLLRCEPGNWCYSATTRVEISHLAKLPELEGTRVRVTATITSAADETQTGVAHSWGILESFE